MSLMSSSHAPVLAVSSPEARTLERSAAPDRPLPDRPVADHAAYQACLETIRALQEENAILRQSADQFAALAERLQKALVRERARTGREVLPWRGAADQAESVAQQIEAEYRAIPNLRLTRWQAARLWNLDQALCDAAIETLVRKRVLRETAGGFVRREDHNGRTRHGV